MDFSSSPISMLGIALPVSLDAVFVANIEASRTAQLLSSHPGQFHYKFRAAILFRQHGNPAAVRLHDLVHDREPQPGATLEIGLQGLENLRFLFGVQSNAGIPEGNAQ